MEFKDYYKILGVNRGADQKAVSAAYRKLARQFHPDVNKAKGAEDRFKEINEAYQVLSDAERRARYDQMYAAYERGGPDWQIFGRGGWTQAPGGWTVTFGGDQADLDEMLRGFGFSDFFAQFFGGIGGAPGRRRRTAAGVENPFRSRQTRPRAESAITVSLDEAFTGARKTFVVQQNGTPRQFDVTIPRGVRDGQTIRLPGALDGADLYLKVQLQPHPYFERRGDDVFIEVPVTVPEAVLGETIDVPTLAGQVAMVIPPGTQNGQVFRLRGQGMPAQSAGHGDQLVKVRVVLPERLSARERQLYEELAKLRRDNPRARFGTK